MPYNKPWNESIPNGSVDLVAELDTIIQDFKIAVRERLEEVIPGFSDDEIQPKVLADVAVPAVGQQRCRVTGSRTLAANTPALLTFTTQEYDTDDMFNFGATQQVTIKTAGVYLITCTMIWDDSADWVDSGRIGLLNLNTAGQPPEVICGQFGGPVGNPEPTVMNFSYVGDFVVGQYFTITGEHHVAANRDVDVDLSVTRLI